MFSTAWILNIALARSVSSRPRAIVSAFVVLAVLALLAAGVRHADAAAISPVVFQDCAEAFLKNSSALLKKRTSALGKCSDALLACKLDAELGSGNFATCSVDAIETCNKQLEKADDAETSALAKLAKVCSTLADQDFRTSVGLGQRRLLAECGVVDTQAEAYDCLLARTRCRANDISEALHPRTYELLNAAGLLATRAHDAECLDVRTPVVASTGDPALLADCQAGLAKTLEKSFSKTPKDISSCVGDLLECQLHEDRLRTNDIQPPACFDNASASCAKADKKVVAVGGADLATKAAAACASVSAADMKSALNFELGCSAAATVADVVNCARGAATAPLYLLVDEALPRTCELGGDSGYDVFTRGNFCTPVCGNNVVEDGEVCDDGNGRRALHLEGPPDRDGVDHVRRFEAARPEARVHGAVPRGAGLGAGRVRVDFLDEVTGTRPGPASAAPAHPTPGGVSSRTSSRPPRPGTSRPAS